MKELKQDTRKSESLSFTDEENDKLWIFLLFRLLCQNADSGSDVFSKYFSCTSFELKNNYMIQNRACSEIIVWNLGNRANVLNNASQDLVIISILEKFIFRWGRIGGTFRRREMIIRDRTIRSFRLYKKYVTKLRVSLFFVFFFFYFFFSSNYAISHLHDFSRSLNRGECKQIAALISISNSLLQTRLNLLDPFLRHCCVTRAKIVRSSICAKL